MSESLRVYIGCFNFCGCLNPYFLVVLNNCPLENHYCHIEIKMILHVFNIYVTTIFIVVQNVWMKSINTNFTNILKQIKLHMQSIIHIFYNINMKFKDMGYIKWSKHSCRVKPCNCFITRAEIKTH